MDPEAAISELASRLSDAETLAANGDLEGFACELFNCQMLVDGIGQWRGYIPENAGLWLDLNERFDTLVLMLGEAGGEPS